MMNVSFKEEEFKMKKVTLITILLALLIGCIPTEVFAATNAQISVISQTTETTNIKDPSSSNPIYDKDWYESDKAHFANLLGNYSSSKTTLYNEYVSLENELTKINNSAYKGAKGYILYSPELTEEYNILTLAVNAREKLLEDIDAASVKVLDNYYPNYQYTFINYDQFQVFAEVGGQTVTSALQIEPTDNFGTYNQSLIADTLDKLPIPDYYLYGNRIFFVNGKPNSDLSGYNNLNSVRGFFDDDIVIFNVADDTNKLISTLVHEVGHSVGQEIFNSYGSDFCNNTPNTKNMAQYAAIYGKTSYSNDANDSWGEALGENFAEDFSQIYSGETKTTSWQGDHKKEVQAFIQSKLAEIDTSNVPVVQSVNIASDGISPTLIGNSFEGNSFYTTNPSIKLNLNGLIPAGNTIGAIVFQDAYSQVVKADSNGVISINLPKTGDYTIMVGVVQEDNYHGFAYETIGKTMLSYVKVHYSN